MFVWRGGGSKLTSKTTRVIWMQSIPFYLLFNGAIFAYHAKYSAVLNFANGESKAIVLAPTSGLTPLSCSRQLPVANLTEIAYMFLHRTKGSRSSTICA